MIEIALSCSIAKGRVQKEKNIGMIFSYPAMSPASRAEQRQTIVKLSAYLFSGTEWGILND